MTSTALHSATAVRIGFDSRHRRRRAASRRSLWRDGLVAGAWLSTVAALAFFLATGPMAVSGPADMLNGLGRLTGLVATNLMLIQVLLAARAPWIERVLGHDKAAKIHGKLGEPVFYLLVAHAVFLTIGWGIPQDLNVVDQTVYFWNEMPNMALAIVGLGVLLVVGVTSAAAVRRRWPYETWHAIHLMAYVSVGLSVPHQFYDGTTFILSDAATWYWLGLYVVAFGSLLVWRVGVPVWRALRDDLRVAQIDRHDDGTVSLTVTGRALDSWYARPGQFFLWRFWTPSLWLTAHPYSLSAAPDGHSLRITVKPLGDDSSALRDIRPGTRVTAAGPYGVFTHDERVADTLVLVGAGIGVTPIRAMAEDGQARDGDTHIVVRARSYIEAPLLDELERLAQERRYFLHVLIGPRGPGWSAAGGPQSLAQIVPGIADADVFVCGPEQWADAVAQDARAAGSGRTPSTAKSTPGRGSAMKTSRMALAIGAGATMLTAGWRVGAAGLGTADGDFDLSALEPTPMPSASPEPSPGPMADATLPAAAPVKDNTKEKAKDKPASTPPKTTAPKPKPTPSKPSGTFKGPAVSTKWGTMQVSIVVNNGKIVDVKPLRVGYGDSRSTSINKKTVPILEQRVLSKQSYKVSYVSGASYTSQGILASVKGAMKKAGI